MPRELPDIEAVSMKLHEAWVARIRADGRTSRESETGEELMVPYAELSEAAKEMARSSVRAFYDAIAAVENDRPSH